MSDSYKKLIEIFKQSPNRDWIEQYLDLIKEIIECGQLKNNDPRLVLSLSQRKNLSVTINRRYVLSGFRKSKPLVGFIFLYDFPQISQLMSLAVSPEFSSYQYKPHVGEIAEQAPYFLALEGFPQSLLTAEQKTAWKQAIISELERCQSSPYKKYHEPIVYQAAVDMNYREVLLNQLFPRNLLRNCHKSEIHLENHLVNLVNSTQNIVDEDNFDVENIEDTRQKITTSIVQREGQAEFRRNLLDAYGCQCLVSGCQVVHVIEAAHIIPYQGLQSNHLSNGLLLRADIHKLFDLHLLSIEPDTYKIVIAPELNQTSYHILAGQKLKISFKPNQSPSQQALRQHYEKFKHKITQEKTR